MTPTTPPAAPAPTPAPTPWAERLRRLAAGLDRLLDEARSLQAGTAELHATDVASLYRALHELGVDEAADRPLVVAVGRWKAAMQARSEELAGLVPPLLAMAREALSRRAGECPGLVATESLVGVYCFKRGDATWAAVPYRLLPAGHPLRERLSGDECYQGEGGAQIVLGRASMTVAGEPKARAFYPLDVIVHATRRFRQAQRDDQHEREQRDAWESAQRALPRTESDYVAAELAALRKEVAELRAAKAAPAAT